MKQATDGTFWSPYLRHGYWSSPYLMKLWRSGQNLTPFVTSAYLDTDGQGVLVTACMFRDSVGQPKMALCVDLRVPDPSDPLNPLRLDGKDLGLVSVSEANSTERFEMKPALGEFTRSFLGAVSFLVAGMLIIGVGFAQLQRLGEANAVSTVLNDIEMGVIVIDADGIVQGANHRAEMVLQSALPRLTWRQFGPLGSNNEWRSFRLGELFDDDVMLYSSLERDAFAPSTLSLVRQLRTSGFGATFFAFLKTGGVVRVALAPFGGQRDRKGRSLLVIDVVGLDTERRVREAKEKAKEKAKK